MMISNAGQVLLVVIMMQHASTHHGKMVYSWGYMQTSAQKRKEKRERENRLANKEETRDRGVNHLSFNFDAA
jgi:DUF971 family protein